jgi:predicted AAA+ superfamily ATPase
VDLVDRPLYLDRIEPFMDAPVVKVLTGLRRSGKSRLLELVAQRLRDRGIPDGRIVHLNFDLLEWASIASAQALNAHLAGALPSEGRTDLYITGSNSRL